MKRTIVLIAVPPLVVAAVVIAILLALAPSLPATLATHWGTHGVNGTDTVGDLVEAIAILVPVMTAVILALSVLAERRGSSTMLERSAVAISVFASSAIALSLLGIVLPQRGLENTRQVAASAPAPWVAAAFAVSVVLALGCAWLTRRVPVEARTSQEGSPALDLSDGERVVWSNTVGAPLAVHLVVLAAGVVAFVAVWWAGVTWLALLEAVLIAFVISMLHWRVIVSSEGILVRSVLGLPRFHVATEDVADARAVPVNPLGQFGGWGIRFGAAGWGVILRTGDAIEVARDGRSSFFVTVNDAATGAALLNTFARARHSSS